MIDTTAMDPIVFANTFNAAQKIAEAHWFELRWDRDVRTYMLVSKVSGNIWATFGDVLQALSWLEKEWGQDTNPTSTHGPNWA